MTSFKPITPLLMLTALMISACVIPAQARLPTAILAAPTQPPPKVIDEDGTAEAALPVNGISPRACHDGGVVERYQFESQRLKSPLYVSVYLPPCYAAGGEEAYPALYLLHGQTFNDRMWIDLGAVEAADDLILSQGAPPFLMVMPYEEFYYRDDEGNQFPEALVEELIPWVERNFNVCPNTACRALGGISRGASWAMRVGLTTPGLFASLGAHSLPTFRGDLERLPGWLEAITEEDMPRIYLDTGRFDPEVKAAYRFDGVLNEKGIPHEWHLNEGRHNEEYWSAQMGIYLRWYSATWEPIQ